MFHPFKKGYYIKLHRIEIKQKDRKLKVKKT